MLFADFGFKRRFLLVTARLQRVHFVFQSLLALGRFSHHSTMGGSQIVALLLQRFDLLFECRQRSGVGSAELSQRLLKLVLLLLHRKGMRCALRGQFALTSGMAQN